MSRSQKYRKWTGHEDGEWVRPKMRNYKYACCDCNLCHTINFRIVDGEIEFQVFRDNRTTGQLRRWAKK